MVLAIYGEVMHGKGGIQLKELILISGSNCVKRSPPPPL